MTYSYWLSTNELGSISVFEYSSLYTSSGIEVNVSFSLASITGSGSGSDSGESAS
jgi:hypothetical protein